MEALLLAILEIFAEVFIQIFAEGFVDLFGRLFSGFFSREGASRAGWTVLSALIGALTGFLSVAIFPAHGITLQWLRLLNLALTPCAAGYLMSRIGDLYEAKDKPTTQIESFTNGFVFALAMALVRYFYAA